MFNRRIEKNINGSTVKFIYDGEQVVGEIKSDGTSTSLLAGLAIDEMIARYANGQQSTYLTDALGSVIAQLKDDQTIRNQYGYSPYGMTSKGQNGTVDENADDQGNASQYTGRENDGTGLYYYRARYYMPSCGRFVSEDPIGLGGGQTNVYAYVGGNPISFNDPSGLLFGVNAGECAGDNAAQYWSDKADATGNPLYHFPGALAALWTPGASDKTFLTLATAGGLSVGARGAGQAAKGLEFSHWIPNRLGGPRSIWNGNFVTPRTHALSDPFRYRFMPRTWKQANPMPGRISQQWERIPNVYKGAGAGAALGVAAGAEESSSGGCD